MITTVNKEVQALLGHPDPAADGKLVGEHDRRADIQRIIALLVPARAARQRYRRMLVTATAAVVLVVVAGSRSRRCRSLRTRRRLPRWHCPAGRATTPGPPRTVCAE